MKKKITLFIFSALCAQNFMHAAQYLQRGRAAAQSAATSMQSMARGAGFQASRAAQQARALASRASTLSQEQRAKLAQWAAPFLSEVADALKRGNYHALPGIMKKYKAQSGAVGAMAAIIVTGIGMAVRAFIMSRDPKSVLAKRGIANANQQEIELISAWMRNDTPAIQVIFTKYQTNPVLLSQIAKEVLRAALGIGMEKENAQAQGWASQLLQLKDLQMAGEYGDPQPAVPQIDYSHAKAELAKRNLHNPTPQELQLMQMVLQGEVPNAEKLKADSEQLSSAALGAALGVANDKNNTAAMEPIAEILDLKVETGQ